MRVRRACWGLTLFFAFSLAVPTADAQPLDVGSSPRALCVTDPYGTPFCSWYGSPVAFNSYFYLSPNGGNSTGYSSTTSGFYLGGVPAVASATTPEWIVQRTSVFPIGAYYPWMADPGAIGTPWPARIGGNPSSPISQPITRRERTASPARDTLIRQVNGTVTTEEDRGQKSLAEGDRLLRDGQHAQAYLRYLDAQREVGDRGEVYFRQAFALVAMRRYSHAIAKLKRGLQVDPDFPRHGAKFDEIFGATNKTQAVDHLRQVEHWANAAPSDPDRLFLVGVMLHFTEDSRANEFFNAAWKLAGRGQHLQAFQEALTSLPTEPLPIQSEEDFDLTSTPQLKDTRTDTVTSRPRIEAPGRQPGAPLKTRTPLNYD